MPGRPGKEANPISVGIGGNQFPETLRMGFWLDQFGSCFPQAEMDGFKIDYLKAEAPAAAGLPS